jgi:DNA-binding CsgD family transcriptional regulator
MFDKPPYAEDHAGSVEAITSESSEWQALERGAKLRCIYHPGFDAERLKELTLFAAKGEDSRTAPVPMKLILVDAQIAMIPSMRSYLPGHELIMSVVRHPTLVEALQWLFEAVWDTAVPIAAAGPSDHDPRRQMLVSLLMAGSTDSAIASSLGINVRSVRRWISDLMDQLGVTTRLQLGAALVRAEFAGAQKQRRPRIDWRQPQGRRLLLGWRYAEWTQRGVAERRHLQRVRSGTERRQQHECRRP